MRRVLVGLAVLAVLAVAAVVVGNDDGDDGDDSTTASTSTSTSVAAGPAVPPPGDDEVAATLLPAVSALGPDWIELAHDDAATSVEPSAEGACPSGPVPEGFLIRSEQRRLVGNETVQTLSVTAGVVAEGVEPPNLEDDAVIECLHDALVAQVAEGAVVESAPDLAVGAGYAGSLVSHQRYRVTGDETRGGTFDFVLVRRGRLVSLGLLTGTDDPPEEQLGQLVLALDAPLSRATG